MASAAQSAKVVPVETKEDLAYFSISDLAFRWRCSRGSVYNMLRGYPVVDFATQPGHRGKKLVAAATVFMIEKSHTRTMR
jgi:hypothetical protein